MAFNMTDAARNAAADAVCTLLDGGTLELQDAGGTEVATLTFGTPAFGAAAAGVATANAITADSNATGGTVAQFVAKASGGAAVFSGSVTDTAGAGPVKLTSLDIAATETVTISSMTFTQPAS